MGKCRVFFFNVVIILWVLYLPDGSTCEILTENDFPELQYLDTTVDPCTDFYQFSCGNFQKIHPRPENANIVDHFTLLENALIRIGYEILTSPSRENEPKAFKKAKLAFEACNNNRQYSGTCAVLPELRTVQEAGGMPLLASSNESTTFTWTQIGDLVGKYGVPLIFNYNIGELDGEKIIRMGPDTLPNPSLFKPKFTQNHEEAMQNVGSTRLAPFDVFLQTIAKHLLKSVNSSKTEAEMLADLDKMAAFMRSLYAGGIKGGEVSPLEATPTLSQLQAWTNQHFGVDTLDWVIYFQKIFQKTDVTITENTKIYHQGAEKIYKIINLVNQTKPEIVKNYALFRIFLYQAPDSAPLTQEIFQNYYKAKNYPLYPRWEYCARKILDTVDTASLSYAVAYYYQHYHFNTTKIPKALKMTEELRHAFSEILQESDWLDVESRGRALDKLDNMLILLAYPDFVEIPSQLDAFYDKLHISQWDNYGNSRNLRSFKQAYQLSQLGNSGRDFWGKSPFDSNAYYNRPDNKIVIPIAMLNPVFFHGNNTILDYSRLGSIVGHEITHGFDNNGKNYNENGAQVPWWSPFTIAAFTNKTHCFIQQYSNYYITEIQTYINGNWTLNENLADNGGVRQAYKAVQKLVKDESIKVTGTYTWEQLFFIGYSTMWCSNESDIYLRKIGNTVNGYPPNKFRVIGSLSNMAEFALAFKCSNDTNMNPVTKCRLW